MLRGSGQNTLVSPHETPFGGSKNKLTGRRAGGGQFGGARGPTLIGKGKSHEILITLVISHVLFYACPVIKFMLFSCVLMCH